jgi:outer membrane protein assembly factor BamB
MAGPLWQSPVIVDDVWIQGDCKGDLHAFNVSNTTIDPPELWSIHLGGCIESTPAVWKGRIYVGTRDGHFFALA